MENHCGSLSMERVVKDRIGELFRGAEVSQAHRFGLMKEATADGPASIMF